MKKKPLLTLLNYFLALGALQSVSGQSAFTYQGKLTDDCCPATGLYDMVFRLYGIASGGSPLATLPVMMAVPVTNGLFTTSLSFASTFFDGNQRWLQTEVRTNNPANPSASFATLLPRTELTPTPYALYAQQAGLVPNGAITPAMINSSGASANQVLTFNGSSVTWGNGVWSLNGPSAYYNSGNVGVGTLNPSEKLQVAGNYLRVDGAAGQAAYMGNAGSFQGVAFGSLNPNIREIDFFNPNVPAGEVGFMNAFMNNLTAFGNISADRGVLGSSANANGVFGKTSSANDSGVYGESGAGNGVAGRSSASNRSGVYGENTGHGTGVAGRTSGAGTAVYGDNQDADGFAGLFDGLVQVNGKLHVYSPGSAPGANIPTRQGLLASGDGFNNRFMSVYGDNALYLSMWHGGYGEISTYDYGTGRGLPLKLNSNGGTVSVPVLEITGGADLAEPFQMSSKDIPKGALVTIDEENAGQLKISDRPYDTRVAGILSGAKGINPGIQLHQAGAMEGGQNVALSGRVYALADASNAPIKPGDLLTTSATPGHCMKVSDHAKAQGAIIGKAMSSLESGQGMVLVLVSLQ